MNTFASNHPYLFSVGVFVVEFVLAFPFVVAFNLLQLDFELLRLVIPIAQSVFVLAVLWYLKWFTATGFRSTLKNLHLLWLPAILVFIPVLSFGTIELAMGSVLFYGFAVLFTAISEEGLARGIILKAMLPKGIWAALLVTGLLFSIGHVTNLFFEDFSALEMAVVLMSTFSFALLYGALFLRTLNILPLILLHTLEDFFFVISGTAGPFTVEPLPNVLHLLIAVLSIAFAAFIVRNLKSELVLQETLQPSSGTRT